MPYGPFHRIESPTQTRADALRAEKTGELYGQGERQCGGGRGIPSVKAYEGPLPAGKRGIEFDTTIKPSPGSAPGQKKWQRGSPGVALVDNDPDWVKIPVTVTKNHQP